MSRTFGTSQGFTSSYGSNTGPPVYVPPTSSTGFRPASNFFNAGTSSQFPTNTAQNKPTWGNTGFPTQSTGYQPPNTSSSFPSYNQTSTFPSTSSFGNTNRYGYGSSSTYQSTGYGQSSQQTMAIDTHTGYSSHNTYKPSGTGLNTQTPYGTASVKFSSTRESDSTDLLIHIFGMPQYVNSDCSPDEIRLQDYALRKQGQIKFPPDKQSNSFYSRPAWGTSSSTGTSSFPNTFSSTIRPSSGFPSSSSFPTSSWPNSTQNSFFRPASSPFGTASFPQPIGSSQFPAPTSASPFGAPTSGFPAPAFPTPSFPSSIGSTLPGAPRVGFPAPAFPQPNYFGGFPQQTGYSYVNTGNSLTQQLIPLQPTSARFGLPGSSEPVGSNLLAQKPQTAQMPTAAGNLAIIGQDYHANTLGLKQYTMYQPDYSDPYGIKSFITTSGSSKETLSFDRKTKEEFKTGLTPYENDNNFIITAIPSKEPINKSYGVLTTSTGNVSKCECEDRSVFAYNKSPPNNQNSNMYTIPERSSRYENPIMKKQTNLRSSTMTNANLLRPKTANLHSRYRSRDIPSDSKYDENSILLNVSLSNKREITAKVRIHKTRDVREIKEAAFERMKYKLKEYDIKDIDPTHYRLIRGTNLLQDDNTIEEAKLIEGDNLVLILDKNEETNSENEEADLREAYEADLIVKTPEPCENRPKKASKKSPELADESLIPNLRKPGYYTKPDYKSFYRMTEEELKKVKNFTIGNEFGRIIFDNETDVSGVDFNDIVEIKQSEVIVYPDEENKPNIGEKLNKPCTIYLENCFPKKPDPQNKDKFLKRLKVALEKQDAEFVSYDSVTGEWVFRVKHFTRYGAADNDDSEEEVEEEKKIEIDQTEQKSEYHEQVSELEPPMPEAKSQENESQPMESEPEAQVQEIQRNDQSWLRASNFGKIEDRVPEARLHDIQEVSRDFTGDQARNVFSQGSGMINFVEANTGITFTDDQNIKRKKLDKNEMNIEAPPRSFIFENEIPEVKSMIEEEPIIDTKYISQAVKFPEISICEEKIHPDFKPRMGQSFRVAWKKDGTFLGVGGISKENGTFELAKYKLNIHKSIEQNFNTAISLEKYKDAVYNKIMKIFLDNAVINKNAISMGLVNRYSIRQNIESKSSLTYFNLDPQKIFAVWKNIVQLLIDTKINIEGLNERIKESIEKLENEAEIWALINCLFGDPKTDLSEYLKSKRFSEYNIRSARPLSELEINILRKNQLINWLKICTHSEKTIIRSRKEQCEKIAELLTQNKISEALNIANNTPNLKPLYGLSSLITNSAISGERVKELIKSQINDCKKNEQNIDQDLLSIYTLLCDSKEQAKKSTWREQLNMKISFDNAPHKKIREIFPDFDKAALQNSLALLPKYLQSQNNGNIYDLCYLLIGTYFDIRKFPLDKILNSKNYTPDNLETRLIFLIYFTLKALFKAPGTTFTPDLIDTKLGFKENKQFTIEITEKMIAELEIQGAWEYGILILLMNNDIFNEKTILLKIEQILLRNIKSLIQDATKEKILIENLKIPRELIYKAKGIFYMNLQDWPRAIRCLEIAKEWNLTHEILWEKTAPCIVCKKAIPASALAIVKSLLASMSMRENMPNNWKNQGMVLKEYLEILQKSKSDDKSRENQAKILESIKRLLINIGEDKKDEIVISKIIEKVKKIAGKIQNEFYQNEINSENILNIVPIPIKTRENLNIDQQILENQLNHMIYRASKSGINDNNIESKEMKE